MRHYTIVIIIVALILSVGATYKSIRFIADYQSRDSVITRCEVESETHFAGDMPSEIFTFKLYVSGIEYPIRKQVGSTSITVGGEPTYNWCKYEGKNIKVYYSDNIKMATSFFEVQNEEPGFFDILLLVGGYGLFPGIIILTITLLLSILFGIGLLIDSARNVWEDIDLKAKLQGNNFSLRHVLNVYNKNITPIVSSVLSILFILFFGLALMRGMYYVETEDNFVNGLIICIGVLLIIFSPAYILKSVYFLMKKTSVHVDAIKNTISLFVLVTLVNRIVGYLFFYDFKSLYDETIIGFIIDVLYFLIGVCQ